MLYVNIAIGNLSEKKYLQGNLGNLGYKRKKKKPLRCI